jgi:hypothetical protein
VDAYERYDNETADDGDRTGGRRDGARPKRK